MLYDDFLLNVLLFIRSCYFPEVWHPYTPLDTIARGAHPVGQPNDAFAIVSIMALLVFLTSFGSNSWTLFAVYGKHAASHGCNCYVWSLTARSGC